MVTSDPRSEPPIHPVGVHPATRLLRPLSSDEYAGLVADIRERRRLLEPIEVYGGPSPDYVGPVEHLNTIIDGVHRARACQEAGVEPRYRLVFTSDPVRYVLARNMLRRHLNSRGKRDQADILLRRDHTMSDRHIALLIGISHPTVAAQRQQLVAAGIIPAVTEIVGRDGVAQRRWQNLPPDEGGGGDVEPSAGDNDLELEQSDDAVGAGDQVLHNEEGLILEQSDWVGVTPETYTAFRSILSPDEWAAYNAFSVDDAKKVYAVRLLPEERAAIQAMRVRKLLGREPSTVAAVAAEVERLRAACSALERELAELRAENVALRADPPRRRRRSRRRRAD